MIYCKPIYWLRRLTLLVIPTILIVSSIHTLIVYANPIPLPIAPLLSEDISINIWVEGGFYVARVDGSYELDEPIGYSDRVTLRFPVPQDSWDISVYVDGNLTSFTKISGGYTCRPIDVPFDILEWTIGKGRHNVRIGYTHKLIDLGNGTFLLVYPIGSSKLAANTTYAKGCRYKVYIKMIPPPGSRVNFEVLKKVFDPTLSTYIYTWMEIPAQDSIFKLEGTLGLEDMFDDLYIRLTSRSDGWILYKPRLEEVYEPRISLYHNCINVTVEFLFRHSGFKVESKYEVSYGYVRFDFYVYEWTGITLPVLTRKTSSLITKPLDPGEYLVRIFVSNIEVASVKVAIPGDMENHLLDQKSNIQAMVSSILIGVILLLLSAIVIVQIYSLMKP